jgi:hypothetical protein
LGVADRAIPTVVSACADVRPSICALEHVSFRSDHSVRRPDFRLAICCRAACASSWRGMNCLYTSAHDCYNDDENNENAKRDQFSSKHAHLPRRRPAPRQPSGARIRQRTELANQESGGARDGSTGLRSAFRNALAGRSEMARGVASATPDQTRPTGRPSATKLPAIFVRVTRIAATA